MFSALKCFVLIYIFMFLEMFGISGPENYVYTCQSNCLDVEGMDDVAEYRDTLVCHRARRLLGSVT